MLGMMAGQVKPLELQRRKSISAPMDASSFDVIVIGAGPAGLTAATEAARAGLKALCLDKLAPGGALINLGNLHDFETAADGPTLASQLTDDATEAGVQLHVRGVRPLVRPGP